MAAEDRTVLVIEDEPSTVAIVRRVCMMLGIQARVFSLLADFEAVARIPDDSIILLDLGLGDSNGIDVLRLLAERRCAARIVLMSGEDKRLLKTVQKLGQSYGLNVSSILQKPFALADLRAALETPARPATAGSAARRASAAEELYHAILRGELRLHYQPKARISPGLVVGCEALIRWQHAKRGLLAPGDFLSVAEENGLMSQLTHWVLNEALRQSAAWRKAGLNLNISVNMPPEMLQEMTLPATIQRLLARHGVDGSSLTLEVTEGAAMRGLTKAVDVLARLRLMRASLSIDDFGTGHSSIVKLRQIPFNELKIDRSFVQDLAIDADAKALVGTMIHMGRSLDMTTVAEGVETASDLRLLQNLGCEIAQGYYLARPMPPADLFEWLQERHLPWQSEELFGRATA